MARLLGLIALWLVAGTAQAAFPEPGNYADQGEAYAACYAWKGTTEATQPGPVTSIVGYACVPRPASNTSIKATWTVQYTNGATQAGAAEAWIWPAGQTCSARGDMANRNFIAGSAFIASGTYCNAGCAVTVNMTPVSSTSGINPVNGQAVTWNLHQQAYSGSPCAADTSPDEDPDTDEDEGRTCSVDTGTCVDSDGDVEYCTFNPDGTPSSCVPAVPDADGDNIPDNRDTHPNDPDNAEDDGDGDEKDNTSTSGVDCDNPPISDGDGLLAQIAYQAWKGRCASEKRNDVTVTGDVNSCSGLLTCTGKNTLECYHLALERKAACAAQATATAVGELGGAGAGQDPNTAGIKANTREIADAVGDDGQGGTDPDAGITRAGLWPEEGTPGGGDVSLDSSGWLSNRACPAPTTVTIMGKTVNTHFDKFCDFLRIGANMVLVLAGIFAARILMKETA